MPLYIGKAEKYAEAAKTNLLTSHIFIVTNQNLLDGVMPRFARDTSNGSFKQKRLLTFYKCRNWPSIKCDRGRIKAPT